jgi:beta-galactosidase
MRSSPRIAPWIAPWIALLAAAPLLTAQPVLTVDATRPVDPAKPLAFAAGGKSPDGTELSVNSRYLLKDGKPWLPVMGEMHFARFPEAYWEEEILKMKAGGIDIISAYVFWIHHEEIQGQFDWSGQRNLRRFVELCHQHGMYVWIRVGPWDHGEVRNGGFPDWLLNTPLRQNDPAYLASVRRFYGEIGGQLKGLMFKDGGPVIGVQIENEYHSRGPGKGEEHILTLRQMAVDAGLQAPFYTITGWDNAAAPARDVLPVFGGYPDAFWDRKIVKMPPNPNYFFNPLRLEENVASDLRAKQAQTDSRFAGYPFLTAEMGGGMEVSYHRRPLMAPDDIAAMIVTKLGSGANLYGYYMFHGGVNPDGKLTTLMESQATGYPNDLPVKAYDFQAPLGAYGQVRDVLRRVKSFHLFLHDFGPEMAPLAPVFAVPKPAGLTDTTILRVAARMDGDHGFLFVNNYERNYPLSAHPGVLIQVKTSEGTMSVPQHPFDIPSGAYFIWPVNLRLGDGARLRYATAQPLAKIGDTVFFVATSGITPEFLFEGDVLSPTVAAPGTWVAFTRKGIKIVVLTREQAENCWRGVVDGRDSLVLSPADVFFEGGRVHLRSRDNTKLTASVYPPPALAPKGSDGVFATYTASVPARKIDVKPETVRAAQPSVPVKMGKEVAISPGDADFDRAGVWRVTLPAESLAGLSDVFLTIEYSGDVARFYSGSHLLIDDFYLNGKWEIGMKRYGGGAFDLKILPLRRDAPIYLAQAAPREIAAVKSVTAQPEYEAVLEFGTKK